MNNRFDLGRVLFLCLSVKSIESAQKFVQTKQYPSIHLNS